MKADNKRKKGKRLADWLPFYYGWLMVPIAVIAQGITGVGQTYGISVFNPSLQQSLGISLSALSGAYTIGTLAAALPQSYIGSLMDRFGIRKTTLGIVLLLGAACLLFARVNSLITLLLGFFSLRLLGQGALSLMAGNIPALWFREKLGTVTGIVSSGFSASMAVLPPFFLYLINRLGWRSAYSTLGVLVWLVSLPLMILLRDGPAAVGQHLDGKTEKEEAEANFLEKDENAWTAPQARKTAAYWIMVSNAALWALVITAVFFNLLSILDSQGISPAVAAATYTTYAAASLITQLAMGPVADRGSLRVLMVLCMTFLAAGIAVLTLASSPWIAHSYAVLIGVSTGLMSLLGGTLFARYYGRTSLGQLRGGMLTAQVAGSSLGPLITGLIFDLSGSFQISLWIYVGILVPAALVSLRAVKPVKSIKNLGI
ncbi:MAG: MFS transporter [Anaerolineales bacterium]